MFIICHPCPGPVVGYRSNADRALQVNTAVVGTHGVPLPVHNIIVAVAQTIPDLQKKWTRFGDNRRVYAIFTDNNRLQHGSIMMLCRSLS